jgi:hypothetical protein
MGLLTSYSSLCEILGLSVAGEAELKNFLVAGRRGVAYIEADIKLPRLSIGQGQHVTTQSMTSDGELDTSVFTFTVILQAWRKLQ